jgi:hypothetical protein
MGGALSGLSGGKGASPQKAAEQASDATYKASLIAIAEQKRAFDLAQANQQPWLDTGKNALALQNRYAGLEGSAAQKSAFAEFMASPEQKYFKQAGADALNRNMTAIQGVGSDRVRAALKNQGAGWASQDYENQYNRLAGLSNTGQATGSQLGALGQNAASSIGNIGMQAGKSMAAGTLAAQQADSATKGQMAGAALTAVATFF